MNIVVTSRQIVEATERLTRTGQSLTDWAKEHSVNEVVAQEILSGHPFKWSPSALHVMTALGMRCPVTAVASESKRPPASKPNKPPASVELAQPATKSIAATLTRCRHGQALVELTSHPFNGLELRPGELRQMAQQLSALADMAARLPTGGKHWKPTKVKVEA